MNLSELPSIPEIEVPVNQGVLLPVDFSRQKEFLKAIVNDINADDLTDASLSRVRIVKKAIVGWRRTFEKESKAYAESTFKTPMAIFKAGCEEVNKEIADMESKVDAILDKEEERRRDSVRMMLNSAVISAIGDKGIDASRIELKEKYFNKTARWEETIEDINNQIAEIQRADEARAKDIEFITLTAKKYSVDAKAYLAMYEKGIQLAEILMLIQPTESAIAESKAEEVVFENDKTDTGYDYTEIIKLLTAALQNCKRMKEGGNTDEKFIECGKMLYSLVKKFKEIKEEQEVF